MLNTDEMKYYISTALFRWIMRFPGMGKREEYLGICNLLNIKDDTEENL